MKKILIILLVTLLGVLQYQLWFTENGLAKTMKLRRTVSAQQQANDELQAKNDKLTNEIGSLQQDGGVAENVARHDLEMIKKGETFYRIVKKKTMNN